MKKYDKIVSSVELEHERQSVKKISVFYCFPIISTAKRDEEKLASFFKPVMQCCSLLPAHKNVPSSIFPLTYLLSGPWPNGPYLMYHKSKHASPK